MRFIKATALPLSLCFRCISCPLDSSPSSTGATCLCDAGFVRLENRHWEGLPYQNAVSSVKRLSGEDLAKMSVLLGDEEGGGEGFACAVCDEALGMDCTQAGTMRHFMRALQGFFPSNNFLGTFSALLTILACSFWNPVHYLRSTELICLWISDFFRVIQAPTWMQTRSFSTWSLLSACFPNPARLAWTPT